MKQPVLGGRWFSKEMRSRIVIAFGIFSLFFCMQLKNLNAMWFVTDEVDNMLGGKAIANGYLLYRHFGSQHMPFSYYISALFELIGFKTVTTQRIAFYGFFAMIWTIIYYRYQCIAGKKALLVYPVLFLGVTASYDMGYAILSEHIAGIGSVILFLEFYQYYTTSEIRISNCIWISLAIILSFGCLFISAFGVAVIVIAVLVNEVRIHRAQKPQKIVYFAQRYVPLVAIVLLPWVLLGLFYLFTHTLKSFIKEAYILNRVYYAKYIGGYGTSALSAIVGFPQSVASAFINNLNLGSLDIRTIIHLVLLVSGLIHVIGHFMHRRVLLGCTEMLFWMALANRSTFDYHGTHWVAFSSLLAAMVLTGSEACWGEPPVEKKRGEGVRVFAWFMVCITLLPYLTNFGALASLHIYDSKDETAYLLETITEPGEGIWQLSMSNEVFMNSNRPAIYGMPGTPWTWDGCYAEMLELLESKDTPRVAYWDEDHTIWGYKQKDYAPEIALYMRMNYTRFKDSKVYFRNDYAEEALRKIDQFCPIVKLDQFDGVIDAITDESTVEQRIMVDTDMEATALYVKFATYARKNHCQIEIILVDDKDQSKTIANIDCAVIEDNTIRQIKINPVSLEGGKWYTLKFVTHDAIGENAITIYKTVSTDKEDAYAVINGVEQDYSLVAAFGSANQN